MNDFRKRYFTGRETESLCIYDLGSQDVNGSYRSIFSETQWKYHGIDMVPGNNVDIVLRTPYSWCEILSDSADVVISGQAFEHIQYFWITILEVTRILKPGGIVCILVPSSGPEHRYPQDCWRYYPDGLVSIADFAKLEVLETSTQWENLEYSDGSNAWHDSVLICHKPNIGIYRNMKRNLKRWLCHRMLHMWIKE